MSCLLGGCGEVHRLISHPPRALLAGSAVRARGDHQKLGCWRQKRGSPRPCRPASDTVDNNPATSSSSCLLLSQQHTLSAVLGAQKSKVSSVVEFSVIVCDSRFLFRRCRYLVCLSVRLFKSHSYAIWVARAHTKKCTDWKESLALTVLSFKKMSS